MPTKKRATKAETAAKKQIEAFTKEHAGVEFMGSVDGAEGQKHLIFKPSRLATLPAEKQMGGLNIPPNLVNKFKAMAGVVYKDQLRRSDLDLASPDVVNENPTKLYNRMRGYYRSKAVFGTYIDTLVNLAISGFQNDCEDSAIKEFYDNWCQDVDIEQVLEWVFQEFYTTGFVRTYKVLGKYEPQINRLAPVKNAPKASAPRKTTSESVEEYRVHKQLWQQGEVLPRLEDEPYREYAERKKRWSKGFVPLAYTVLNPTSIEIKGSVLFNQTRIVMTPSDEMIELVNKVETKTPLTDAEQKIIDNIPPEIKSAVTNKQEVELDSEFVGEIDYRRQPWEKYPIPKGARAAEDIEMKENLKEADYSTIDGITSELLVITVGDKDFPVTSEDELAMVSALFNTAQKAYSVVWNHTLKVQRLPVENIDQIFGVKKFEQVERDISGSFGVCRALVDGLMYGEFNPDTIKIAIQSLIAEISYARRTVARWLYREYKQIAEAFGFDRYPSVRWDTVVLKDEIAFKTLVQGLVDRRIISYDTAQKMLGFDPNYEQKTLTDEFPEVMNGHIGLHGSPYQQSANSGPAGTTPKKSPSEGRPKTSPAPKTPSKPSPQGQTDYRKKAAYLQWLKELSTDEFLDVYESTRSVMVGEYGQMLDFALMRRSESLSNLLASKMKDHSGVTRILSEESEDWIQ
jgi:hypothetical protein